ncbi:hypothetical protein CEXT_240771 [Caerostris extrusa]|uniref:Uncharacterized protein n=1 Tax=Caerostris extrusa TaxID=172846 RepID=A0AAV4XFG1_CAEEX|nr:hypothetical protein CEXT_240771 [Caerostris extrusa]
MITGLEEGWPDMGVVKESSFQQENWKKTPPARVCGRASPFPPPKKVGQINSILFLPLRFEQDQDLSLPYCKDKTTFRFGMDGPVSNQGKRGDVWSVGRPVVIYPGAFKGSNDGCRRFISVTCDAPAPEINGLKRERVQKEVPH